MDYLDFDLEISPGNGKGYQVVAHSQYAGEAQAIAHFVLENVTVRDQLAKLQTAIQVSTIPGRSVMISEEELSVQEFGSNLFHAFIQGDILKVYNISSDLAQVQVKGHRLKLHILASELSALPWEFLYDPHLHNYICLSSRTPIVRYSSTPRSIQPIKVSLPLRILAMIANPNHYGKLNIEHEKHLLQEVLKDLETRGLVKLSWLNGQTRRDLQRAMQESPWHIFHFIGYGGFDSANTDGVIELSNAQGMMQSLTAKDLASLLVDNEGMRLVFLSIQGESKNNDLGNAYHASSTLTQQGIPAVVGMYYKITEHASIEFMRTFYESIMTLPVDIAVAEARKAIKGEIQRTLEWGVPTLYLRSSDSRLFELPESVSHQTGSTVTLKDFFISYNSLDRNWAEWIAWQLDEAGYTVVLQAWDFRPGSNFLVDMDKAHQETKRTIVVLSSHYLKALFTQPEWAARFEQDPTGAKGLLVPLRVEECAVKGLLKQIVYIDLVGLYEQEARERLLTGIDFERSKPLMRPNFPLAPSTEQKPFPGASRDDKIRQPRSDIFFSPPAYTEFLAKREKLIELIRQQQKLLESLEMMAWKNNLQQLEQTVYKDIFKVLITGEPISNKSALVNAFLGQKLLPSFALPTIDPIIDIQWGEQSKAVLHFLSTTDGPVKKPLEVPIEQLGQYIIIQDSVLSLSTIQEGVHENLYEKVDVFLPLDFNRNIELISAPAIREVLESQLSIDVVFYVIACNLPFSQSEIQNIKMIREAGHEHLFFICNGINMVDEEVQDAVMKHWNLLLAPFTKGEEEHIFFVDARSALAGRINGNMKQIQQSNILQIEEVLKTFLVTEPGNLKLKRHAYELKIAVQETQNALAERRELLHASAESLQLRYAETRERLDQLVREYDQISMQLTSFRSAMQDSVYKVVFPFHENIATKIEDWLQEYQAIQTQISSITVPSREIWELIVENTRQFLSEKTEQEFKDWQISILHPHLADCIDDLLQQHDSKRPETMLDNLRMALLLRSPIPPNTLIWNSNPFVAKIAESMLAHLPFARATEITDKELREKAGKEYERQFRELQFDLTYSAVKNIDSSVSEKLREIQDALAKWLDLKIQAIQDQLNAIKKEQQNNYKGVVQTLTAASEGLKLIEVEVESFINQIERSL